jgi:bifunctional UDP-N-acetylglucosamine pyrophosphorylase/glucosamine-1-phosphate N-acetyltransferase
MEAVSVVFAAGRGSRMKRYNGNKTLLPLIPGPAIYEGERPMLLEVLNNLPGGPKGIVVNYRADDVIEATSSLNVTYIHQPVTNGTGGALIAAQDFIKQVNAEMVIVTMGDAPLIRSVTYHNLLAKLQSNAVVVVGFTPQDKAQYGVLEIDADKVKKITEWKYWKDYPLELKQNLSVCNSGIYGFKRNTLIKYIDMLKKSPHTVEKEHNGHNVMIEEFFITDLIELVANDGLDIGYIVVHDEKEVMGVDTDSALMEAQACYARRCA